MAQVFVISTNLYDVADGPLDVRPYYPCHNDIVIPTRTKLLSIYSIPRTAGVSPSADSVLDLPASPAALPRSL